MRVSSTEVQNNFGRYLMLAANEPITITKNGKEVAQLTSLIKTDNEKENIIAETSSKHLYGGKKATFEEYRQLTGETKTKDRYEYIKIIKR